LPARRKRGNYVVAAPAVAHKEDTDMPSMLSKLPIAALAAFALFSSPAFAGNWPSSSGWSIHAAQYSLKQQKQFKRPQVLPPNPCRKQVCVRPRPR
jgi:hypothetical protein